VEEAGCKLQPQWAHGAKVLAPITELKERHGLRGQIFGLQESLESRIYF
jgi:hypothetical protein